MGAIFIGGGIAIVVLIIIGAFWYGEKKRSAALEVLADSLKFSFSKKGDGAVIEALGRFLLFSKGHSKKITNVMKGCANEIDVTIMDYRYTTGGGKSSHTWIQTVIVFQSKLLRLPAFTLQPENLFHKIGAAFGYQDIDFDSHPKFSKQYLLRGAEEEAIRSVFTRDLLEFYEQSKGMSTEGDGDTILFYRVSKKVPPANIGSFMEEGFTLFSLVKA